jgi:hypothetical protein
MEMVPMSKRNRKSSPKKDPIVDPVVDNRETTRIAETVGMNPGEIRSVTAAASPALMGVTSEERHQLIARAAYLRAEQRNFTPGYELEDWLGAEAEIEMKFSKIGIDSPQKDA